MLGRVAVHSGKTVREIEEAYSWTQIIALFEVLQLERVEFLQMIFGKGEDKKQAAPTKKDAQIAKGFFAQQKMKSGGIAH